MFININLFPIYRAFFYKKVKFQFIYFQLRIIKKTKYNY